MLTRTQIKQASGLSRGDIPREFLVGGALPGLILTSDQNGEYLCEAEQSYLDVDTHPTHRPEDYVLVKVVTTRAWNFACEVSYQNSRQDHQDEILYIHEGPLYCCVTCQRQDGTTYQESIDLDEWYEAG